MSRKPDGVDYKVQHHVHTPFNDIQRNKKSFVGYLFLYNAMSQENYSVTNKNNLYYKSEKIDFPDTMEMKTPGRFSIFNFCMRN